MRIHSRLQLTQYNPIRRNHRRAERQAFTLMELLMVLAILLVIMGLVVPRLIGRQKAANIDATRISIEGLSQALKLYSVDHEGNFPSTSDGLRVLMEPTKKDPQWKGPYLEKPPVDAWGEPLQYRSPGLHNVQGYDIYSSGPDRAMGTTDDIGNW